jgi:hypothetical protein
MILVWIFVGLVAGIIITLIFVSLWSDNKTDHKELPCTCDFNDPSFCPIPCGPKRRFIEDCS